MADDVLEKHQSIVSELKTQLGAKNFDAIFKKLTSSLTKPEQFIIKMEMNRLSQPIDRFIDLRGHVTGEVIPYVHNGKQHFMDDLAIEVFEEQIEKHGKYTLAVYEAVMNTENNHKVIAKKEAQQRANPDAHQEVEGRTNFVQFAAYESRSEERMNYSIKVKVEIEAGNQVMASTSDISVSGCKIKISPRYKIKKDQKLSIRLVGLEQEFELGLKSGIEYQVVAIEPESRQVCYVRMKRTFAENSSGFDDFLRSFIHGNKRRYKVNLDNTLDAVIIKGYEQYYLPRVKSLYVYLGDYQGKFAPDMVLVNENNIGVLAYFNDEDRQSTLAQVLNPRRIHALGKQNKAVKEELLYTFTHIAKGKVYFYSATASELASMPDMANLFIGFGAQKASFRVFKLQLMPTTANDAHIPLSLPDSAASDVAKLNAPPSPRVMGMLKRVTQYMLLTDATANYLMDACQLVTYPKDKVNLLKKFGHAKRDGIKQPEVVRLEYINLRAEKRYLYKTDVITSLKGAEVSGYTRDLSAMGLQIELAEASPFSKGDIVELALPEMQKITKKHTLSKLPYEVMAISKTGTTLNLRADVKTDKNKHVGVQFFNQIIEANKDKLHALDESPKVPGLSDALRNMATKSVCNFPFYIHKKGANYRVGAFAKGAYGNSLHALLQSFGHMKKNTDLSAVFTSHVMNDLLIPQLKNLRRQDKPLQFDLLMRFNPKANSLSEALTVAIVTLETDMDGVKDFVSDTLNSDLFFAYRISLSRTGRPDTEYLAKELAYISQYAIHKAKTLEDELWSVVGVGDCVDVSDAVATSVNSNASAFQQMQNRKQLWLERVR